MKGLSVLGGRLLQRAAQIAVAALAVGGVGAAGGCLERPLAKVDPTTTATVVIPFSESSVDKIDLLLMIDNSSSMADKQQILAAAVPALVSRLVNPRCMMADGVTPAAQQPPDPNVEACPDGTSVREFKSIKDVHIGIVSSSLGGRGSSTACPDSFACTGGTNTSNNDKGELVFRSKACSGTPLPTYSNQGFLAWDPAGKLSPAGEAVLGAGATDTTGLIPALRNMVIGTDQLGCGFEAQMESWYRFLVDPDPYDTLTVDGSNNVVKAGVDQTLLTQRKNFLRPDSLLAIIGLSDENDCSYRTESIYWIVGNTRNGFRLWNARSECASNPADPCCASCGEPTPAGCQAQAGCDGNSYMTVDKDDVNERCLQTKKRFGIDFLYPIDRYKNGLTQMTVSNSKGEVVKNPIFDNLQGTTGVSVRPPSLVFMAYIVGVPWQDIARVNAQGLPDLINGLDEKGNATGGFKSSAQLTAKDANGNDTWDYVLGSDPNNYRDALDPHMIESTTARSGTNALTGVTLAPPGSAAGADAINGHEYTVGMGSTLTPKPQDDLQYACIFNLPTPRDCADPANTAACDCAKLPTDSPLCDPDPITTKLTYQTRAKGYPGIRELTLIRDLGAQGIVGSICPAQMDSTRTGDGDYGYSPAIGSIVARLKTALGPPCLPRALTPEPDGTVDCVVLDATPPIDGVCPPCDATPGHAEVSTTSPDHSGQKVAVLADPSVAQNGWSCVCEVKALAGSGQATDCSAVSNDLGHCQCDEASPVLVSSGGDGWCYVSGDPPVGNPNLVSRCAASEKQLVRFTNQATMFPKNALLFISCQSPGLSW